MLRYCILLLYIPCVVMFVGSGDDRQVVCYLADFIKKKENALDPSKRLAVLEALKHHPLFIRTVMTGGDAAVTNAAGNNSIV